MGTITDSQISARVVIYGPPGGGAMDTLSLLASRLKKGQRGDLREEQIAGVRYPVLPVSLGDIQGRQTEFEFVAVPDAWAQSEARRVLLKGVDGLIFVADSRGEAAEGNHQSLMELKEFLRSYGKSLVATPVVFQWNNQHATGAVPPDELSAQLNDVRAPAFAVTDNDLRGVFQAFSTISKITLKKVREDFDAGLLQAPEVEEAPAPAEAPGGSEFPAAADTDTEVAAAVAGLGPADGDLNLLVPLSATDELMAPPAGEADFVPSVGDVADAMLRLDEIGEAVAGVVADQTFVSDDEDDDGLSVPPELLEDTSAPQQIVSPDGGDGDIRVVAAGKVTVQGSSVQIPLTLYSADLDREFTIELAIQIR